MPMPFAHDSSDLLRKSSPRCTLPLARAYNRRICGSLRYTRSPKSFATLTTSHIRQMLSEIVEEELKQKSNEGRAKGSYIYHYIIDYINYSGSDLNAIQN